MKSSSLKQWFFGFACRKRISREFFRAATYPMNIHQAGVLTDRFMFSSVNHALEKRVKFRRAAKGIRDQSVHLSWLLIKEGDANPLQHLLPIKYKPCRLCLQITSFAHTSHSSYAIK